MNTEKRRRTAVASRGGGTPAAPAPATRRRSSLTGRLRYRFDLALARGPLVVIGYLGLIMLAIILVAATLDTLLRLSGVNGGGKLDFPEAFWQSLLRVLDSGTFASDQHWTTRIISLLVTIAGIFLAGSLIGLIANAVDQKIESLRKGRSDVLETGHTLVLGWSPRLPAILAELVIANANHRKEAFVVLSERPKDEMEDELRRAVPDTRTTRVVCRTGDTGDPDDLRLVNVDGARSVIVLAGDQGDAGVVKAVLAVRSLDPTFEHIRVVAEMDDAAHADTLRALTDGRIATVRADEVISQVTAQACHQSGLAGVFRDLLDFDGDEIYFADATPLTGHTYREALRAYDTASVIGRFRDGQVQLNPPVDSVFEAGDQVIAIAADDDRVEFSGFVDDIDIEQVAGTPFTEPPQRIAIIGWSALGQRVLGELDEFLASGSSVDVIVDRTVFTADEVAVADYEHCQVRVHAVEPGPTALLALLTGSSYDQVIVLGYRQRMDPVRADARSMLTLLALHRIWGEDGERPRVVAEMLDGSNVGVAQTTGVNDFIVSDELSSLMMAQLSERLELQDVFAELFDADGCFVSLHPARLYAPAHETTFASIVASAAERGASALGYRIGSAPVVLNPFKSTRVTLGPGDQVLVLAPRAERVEPDPALEIVAAPEPAVAD